MQKMLLSLIAVCAFTVISFGQKSELYVHSGDKGLYLDHKVVKGESFYAIGKKYNVGQNDLAAYNKLDINKGLKIDQKIRIPLTENNFTQKGNSGTPVYYKTGDDEKLSAISKRNGNVSIATLKQWNGTSGDVVKKNVKLVIGFLKSKEMPSVTIKPKEVKEEVAVTKVEEPVLTKTEIKEEKKEAEKELEAEKKMEKEQLKKAQPVAVVEKKLSVEGDGFFKSDFEKQIRLIPVSQEETVTAGIFRTTSGWEDGKYYLLIDNVQPGTIVQIINPTNNKTIYAKVLGEMAGIRQNEGYGIRISNAGEAVLAVTDPEKFIVKINF